MAYQILVVDDEPALRMMVQEILTQAGYAVCLAGSCREALTQRAQVHPDAILLDVMLPDGDGFSLLGQLRQQGDVPVLFLSARDEDEARLRGLGLGADDYIVKPFEMKELIARINAVLRRTEIPNDTSKKLHFDKLTIDLDSYELIVDGKKIDTPPKELELLYHLASTPNRVYTRNQLLDEVWGFDYFGDSRTVDVHIKRLREKVEGVSDQWALKTVWGVGYKFETVGGQTADKAK